MRCHSASVLAKHGRRLSVIVCSVAMVLAGVAILSPARGAEIQFNRDIRPVLSENCYHCHGPDEDKVAGDLRLDLEDQAKEYVIIEGDSEASELMLRITSDDVDLKMPPHDSERSLTDDEIELLRQWIDQGAKYEQHWSFTPVASLVIEPHDSPTAIDALVDETLLTKGLQRSEPADRATLLRRATFTLTGLPPSLEELERFLADKSPMAYRRVLNRLLADPAFGERMAADWLDVARYSDTYGYQVDRDRFVWPWRDWVIEAYNRNLPYDEFVTQQLAGDLLPSADRDTTLATTFNRLHPQKVEGGSVPEEFRIEYVADRVQTMATAFMGLTFECCRCHNHKYDPISQKEYFQLAAYFDNIDEAGLYSFFTNSIPTPTLELPTSQQERQLAEAIDRVITLEQEFNDCVRHVKTIREESSSIEKPQPILSLDFEEAPKNANQWVDGVAGKAYQLTGDDPVNTKVGNFSRWQPFSISLWIRSPDVKDRAVVFHRSRAWTDAASRGYQLLIEEGKLSWSLIHFWPGNAIRVKTEQTIPTNTWTHVTVTSDGSSRAAGLKVYLNGALASTSVVQDSLTKQITGGGGVHLTLGQRFRDRGFTNGSVDSLRVFEIELTELEVRQLHNPLIETKELQRDRNLLAKHQALRNDAGVQVAQAKLQEAQANLGRVRDSIQEIMVMRERPTPRTTYRLGRGHYENREESVEPGTPATLPVGDASLPPNRLGLAQWLCGSNHPLTRRVAANRLWQLCFGVGLVRTPEDFGNQGSPPTHPDLLDWLASSLMRSDWDVKRTINEIMLSATYRQGSEADAERLEIDPEHRWLSRYPAHRLPAEMLRDAALASGGMLVRTLGGPPVRPYEVESSFKPSKRDSGAGLYRRSLYTYWKRTSPAPAMLTFDAAKRDVCRVQRERTQSPLQAFIMLNGPQYVEAARVLAEQLLRSDEERPLHQAFQILTSHPPSDAQTEVLSNLYQSQLKYFEADRHRVTEFLSIGELKPDTRLDAAEVAALSVVVGMIMNYDGSMVQR